MISCVDLKYLLNDIERKDITEWDKDLVKQLINSYAQREESREKALKSLSSIRGTLKGFGACKNDLQLVDKLIERERC